jgi:phage regulator Rha-like protein
MDKEILLMVMAEKTDFQSDKRSAFGVIRVHELQACEIPLLWRFGSAFWSTTAKRLNEQVRRNIKRFPADFLFRLTSDEVRALRSQFATLKHGRGHHRKYLPYAFTEHGAIMAATILNSSRAVEISVYIVRAFVKLRELLSSNKELARQFSRLEARLGDKLAQHDEAIAAILSAIRELMRPPAPKRRGIGFTADIDSKR